MPRGRRNPDAPRRMTPKEREIDECYRRMNIPNSLPETQAYYRGKLKALQADRDTPWGHADLVNPAVEMVRSDDIIVRAEGCGMLYGDPVGSAVNHSTYRLNS